MARVASTDIKAELPLGTVIDWYLAARQLARSGQPLAVAAVEFLRQVLNTVRVNVTIPINGDVSEDEAERLAEVAVDAPGAFIRELLEAIASPTCHAPPKKNGDV